MSPNENTTQPEKKKKKKKEKPEPKNWLHGLWLNWIKPIGIAVLVVFSFRSSFADWNDVPSASMEPTILVGDRIFVNKLAYDLKFPFTRWHLVTWGGPHRGDVVVFFAPQDGRRMVKRVIGLPGDTIAVVDNRLIINGEPVGFRPINTGKYERLDLDPDRGRNGNPKRAQYRQGDAHFELEPLSDVVHPVMYSGGLRGGNAGFRNWGPEKIPPGKYLMMGDNRNNSRDSRDPSLGFIPRSYIVGKASGVAFSIDHVPHFRARWGRFLRAFDHEKIEADGEGGDDSDF